MTILLSTLNARYAHASLGLRYLLANMGALQEQTSLMEFVIGAKTVEVVERLLAKKPRIVGFGIYIWNVEETTKVVAMLKRVAPEVTVVLGGPEVSYETNEQEIARLADYVVTGWGEAVGSHERKAAQVDWVVAKPFDTSQIVEITREVFRRREGKFEVASAIVAA